MIGVHQTCCMSVCETLRKYCGNVEHVKGLENVGKQTPLDPMETVCLTRVHQMRCVLVCETPRKYVAMLSSYSALVSPHFLKNDECYMCSVLVPPHGLKSDECYMYSALVLRHGFKNDIYFTCSVLVSSHG